MNHYRDNDDDTPVPPPVSWLERHQNVILWLLGSAVMVFLAYSDLRVQDTAMAQEVQSVREAAAAGDQSIKAQLDRIEAKVQSIEEFLRNHDKANTTPAGSAR